jgi:membrane protease YdiL (CAAX protease family)
VAVAGAAANLAVATTLKIAVLCATVPPEKYVAVLMAESPHLKPHSLDISWMLIVIVSVVNAFLEELVFVGYAFNQLAAWRGPVFAQLVMAFLRMLLHTYKGPLPMLGIGAFSIIYGEAYCRLRRLWPLILGHALTDLVAFGALKMLYGR